MDWHASLIRKVIGPAWATWEGSRYLHHYRHLLRTQYEGPEQVHARQWKGLKRLLRHAYETVPFYRDRLDRAGLTPEEVRKFDDFRRLPVLTKEDLRQHGGTLLSRAYALRELHRKTTSGSTGVSVEVWVDDPSMQWKRACTLRSDEWSGWRFGEPVAKVWGNPEYLKRGWRGRLRNALLERAHYLDTLKMDEAALARFARDLQAMPPSLLFGHAHSVYLLAEYLRARGIKPPRPRGIITTAMVLHTWQRKSIEQVFDCKVTNRYGCEEVSLIACECERHEGLHVNADGVYVEVLCDGRPAGPGEAGSVIVTDLTNRAMPILRYQVGDVAVVAGQRCGCGRGLPLLERIEGREADYVVTPAGELISGISLTENFAVQVPGIAQLQIVQESVSRFVFRIVRSPAFGQESLGEIERLVRVRFGPAVRYDCEYVERIPQEPSGKYRFCISQVPTPFTHQQEIPVG
ncbi:MAG: phenylacetate--CoA ligase family protein [Planctomycetes bacterium]|nr:phenylacetate--CoA ligase family protein [Planctomycetota bacterium]